MSNNSFAWPRLLDMQEWAAAHLCRDSAMINEMSTINSVVLLVCDAGDKLLFEATGRGD
jgi:hypothetical protein